MRVHSPNLGEEGNEPSFPSPPKEWWSLDERWHIDTAVRSQTVDPKRSTVAGDLA